MIFRYWNFQQAAMSRPLGRWMHCGDKNVIQDVLEWKVVQKQRRQILVENGIDPYRQYQQKENKSEEDDDDYEDIENKCILYNTNI